MKRLLTATVLSSGLFLTLAAVAPAKLTELGQLPATVVATPPSCPTNCKAVSRTTGYQAKLGSVTGPFVVPRDGNIVAWTITLGKPNAKQIAFFDTTLGGPASAGIADLRPLGRLNYTLISQSPVVLLQPYFGMAAQFPLDRTLKVKKGDVIALEVPTWAPALALKDQLGRDYGNDMLWRASRGRNQCSDFTTQTAQTQLMSMVQYFCLYRTARLTYTVTLVSTP